MMENHQSRDSLWKRLTRPHPKVSDPHIKRILGLVAAWHLVTIPLGPLLAALQVAFGEADRVSGLWLYVAPVATLVNYLLSRSRWGQTILWMQVWSTFGIVVAALFISPDRAATSFALMLPVLAAALCFGLRQVLLVQGLALLVVMVNISRAETEDYGSYIGVAVVLFAAFIIIAAMVGHREWLHQTTIRQLSEEAVRARALMTAGFDGTADLWDGRLSRVTEGFASALGSSVEDLEGQLVQDVLPFAEAEESFRQEAVPFLDRNGVLRYLFVLRQPMPGQDSPSEVIAVRDQTHEQLHKANLQFTDRMASIGTLASGVAHEVNNALMALSGHSEVGAVRLRQGKASEAEESFAAISESAERISTCVKQLQRFGEGVDSTLERTNLNEVVDSTVSLARHQVRHIARLDLELAEELPPCKAVDNWVGQIVMNLLLNSLDALKDTQQATILVSTYSSDHEVFVRVSDNGPGVPQGIGSKIFQPFFSTKGEKGSGLGLSISASLAARMNGTLTSETTDGGASFVLRLRRCIEEAQEAKVVSEIVPPSASQRVLLLDDDPGVLRVLTQLLEPAEVVAVSSVDDAKKLASNGDSYDLILSDIVLPQENGLEFREWICQTRPELLSSLVLMTGSAVGSHEALRELPETQRVLYKPLSQEALWKALHFRSKS